MPSDTAFIGVHLSSRRKPFTFAWLDDSLNLLELTRAGKEDLGEILSRFQSTVVCVVTRWKSKAVLLAHAYALLEKQLGELSIQPYAASDNGRQWFKADADEVFSGLLQNKLFSHRTLEGRIQRALVLYDRGVQIDDPMEFFVEITRYKLMQGVLPLENIYSPRELDVLVAAYLAWMTVNRPQQIRIRGEFILPMRE